MAKTMTKSAIIAHLAQKTSLSKKQVVDVMDQLLSLATKEAKNVFVLPNFGRLVLANRKARMGRNPQTGEPIKIPAKRVVKFRLAKSSRTRCLARSNTNDASSTDRSRVLGGGSRCSGSREPGPRRRATFTPAGVPGTGSEWWERS
jgi:DNA-binding protein HU-beta